MTIESKINKLENRFRLYKPKTIDRAIAILQLFGNATDEEIMRHFETSIRISTMSDEELERLVRKTDGIINEV